MSNVDLTPRVKGKLAAMELAAIAAIKNAEPFRTTISINPEVALLAVRAADREERDFSNFAQVVIGAHAKVAAEPDAALAELLAKLAVACQRRPELRRDVERLAKGAARKSREAVLV